MRRIIYWLTFGLLAASILALPLALHAQATIPVSGSKVVDNNRQPLTGQLVFTVTDTTDTPITYTPQGGSPTTATFTIPVVAGAVQNIGGFPPTIANPLTMTPANTRYRIKTQSTGGGTTNFTFPLTNITTASFSYDGYIAPAGITISGAGIPTLNCNPSAMYNNTLASDPYPWVCSRLQGDASLYWTQNPSLNPSCQRGNDQAIASAINGSTFCIDSNQAFVTPGFVWAGPLPGQPPSQIGLVPLSTLCASGDCGVGLVFAATPKLVVNTSQTFSRNAVFGDVFSLFSGPCTGTNVPMANGTCGPAGGIPAGAAQQAQFNSGSSTFAASNATFDAPGNFKSLSNDGLKNAFLNQTTPTSNDGIQNSLQTPGSIVVAGNDYGCTEGGFNDPNGYRLGIGSPAPFANNTMLLDQRGGCSVPGQYVYNSIFGISPTHEFDRWVSNQQPQTTSAGTNMFPYRWDFELTGSGKNGFEGGGPDSYGDFQWTHEFMRRGIMSTLNIEEQAYSLGDNHIWQNSITNNRGTSDASAEGFNTVRNNITQNLTPLVTTANATLAAGATLIQGTLLSNVPFPGDGTYYIDFNKAFAALKILAFTDPGDTNAGQFTVDATLVPDNIGRTSVLVSTPSKYNGATTNETVTVTGLTSAINTTQTVCYADPAYQESARVISAGAFAGGTQTITVALRYVHRPNSYVVQGPHACNLIEIRANEIPGTFPGRQLFRIIGAVDSHHYLFSRTIAGHWGTPSGFFTTNFVAPAGATYTRNSSNIVSVAVTDPFRVLSNIGVLLSGCTDPSFNGLFQVTANTGSLLSWTSAGAAGTTTCSATAEILSRLNSFTVREAQEFPGAEIVNTVDPVTFANNFNISVEPNTNFQVTAGDHLENHVYSDVAMGFDHNLMDFQTQTSPSIGSIMHLDELSNEIPEGIIWQHVQFDDSPLHYQGLGGTKGIGNTLFSMSNSVTPFNVLWDSLPAPKTAAFTFSNCLFGCADIRSTFQLFGIPTNGGSYSETIHQDTGEMDTVTRNSSSSFTRLESPAGLNYAIDNGVNSNLFHYVPGEITTTVRGGGGTNSFTDQTVGAITSSVIGTFGAASHVNQTVTGWSVDVPATFIGTPNGCATFTSGVLGSTTVACNSGAGFTLTTTGTDGAATLVGSVLNIPVYTPSSPGVVSFNTRAGAVVPAIGDYSFSLLSGSLSTSQGPSSLTGLLKDAAGTLSAAVAGTDYVIPSGNAATATLAANSSAVGGVALSGLCQTGGSGCPTAGSGNTTSASLTTNKLPKANGPNSLIDSGWSDDGTKATYTGSGTANGELIPEGTPIAGVAGSAAFYPSSTTHRLMQNPNNIGALMIPGEATAITPAHLWAAAANGIDMVDGGSGTSNPNTCTANTALDKCLGVSPYLAIAGDWSTAINQAMTDLASTGGNIYGCGLYPVNGPLLDPTGANALIKVPTILSSGNTNITIKILGCQYTTPNAAALSGMTLQTSVDTAGGNFIGGFDAASTTFGTFTAVRLVMEHVNVISTRAIPNLNLLNASWINALSISDVILGGVGCSLPSSSTGGIGLQTPNIANNFEVTIDKTVISCMPKGAVVHEHTQIGTLWMSNLHDCITFDGGLGVGSALGANAHSVTASHMWAQGCVNYVVGAANPSAVNISLFDMESDPGTGTDILDPSNLISGFIYFRKTNPSGVGTISGGTNLVACNLNTAPTCFSSGASGPPLSLHTGLIENWVSQQGQGSVIANNGFDFTNNLTGTAVTWAPATGFTGNVATYNGTSSVSIATTATGTAFDGTTPFSACAWFNVSTFTYPSGDAFTYLMSTLSMATGNPGWRAGIFGVGSGTPGRLDIYLSNNVSTNFIHVTSTAVFSTGAIQLGCFTYDGSKTAAGVIPYINGTASATTISSNTLTGSIVSTAPLFIGGEIDNHGWFPGAIGRVRIYNRLLSTAEITAMFTAGPNAI